MELPPGIQRQHLRPVHAAKIGHERRIGVQQGGVRRAELLSEDILMQARQAGSQGLQILMVYLAFQRTAGHALHLGDDRMQLVVLEDLGKIVQLPGKGHHGKAGQVLVLEHVVIEGGEQLARLHQRVALGLLKRLDQTETNMYRIKEGLELRKGAARQRLGKRFRVLPGQAVLAENFLPFEHASPSLLSK